MPPLCTRPSLRHPIDAPLSIHQPLRAASISPGMASMTLPPRPSSICPSCWNGPFAARLGLFGNPIVGLTGGYEYTISAAKLLLRAEFGCMWCIFLVKCIREMNRTDDLKESEDTLCIRAGRKGHNQILSVSVDNVPTNKSGYIVTTTPGAFSGNRVLSVSTLLTRTRT